VSPETELQSARAVADAVMYEGYLLYPYRASAAKNQIRWQFGVLGPQRAAVNGVGEEPDLVTEVLVRHGSTATVTIRLRFLQLQSRGVESIDAAGEFVSVDELQVDGQEWRTWDEAVEHEVVVASVLVGGHELDDWFPVSVEGAVEEPTEIRDQADVLAGRLVRRRWPLAAMVHVRTSAVTDDQDASRLHIRVENVAMLAAPAKVEALGRSFLGAHLLLTVESGEFVSLLDPPPVLLSAAQECRQHRCWPVLAGPAGTGEVLLVSPIILEDHPALADESAGALFDSTEIDEILTLRILTMTEDEKSQARATDPRAAQIIDRSEGLSEQEMARMHGALRNPHALEDVPTGSATGTATEVPWWDPERDASVNPGTDTVLVDGHAVGRGSLVRIHPNRRADAQDLFFADQVAKVTGVHFDVDGATHVGVVLVDDPAADVNEWYGRFLYFAPDELEPLTPDSVEPQELLEPDQRASIERRIPAVQGKEN